MNRRLRRSRTGPPTWIGPVLWLLAVAFLALTIAILVEAAPHRDRHRASVAAALVCISGSRVVPRSVLWEISMDVSGDAAHEAGKTMFA